MFSNKIIYLLNYPRIIQIFLANILIFSRAKFIWWKPLQSFSRAPSILFGFLMPKLSMEFFPNILLKLTELISLFLFYPYFTSIPFLPLGLQIHFSPPGWAQFFPSTLAQLPSRSLSVNRPSQHSSTSASPHASVVPRWDIQRPYAPPPYCCGAARSWECRRPSRPPASRSPRLQHGSQNPSPPRRSPCRDQPVLFPWLDAPPAGHRRRSAEPGAEPRDLTLSGSTGPNLWHLGILLRRAASSPHPSSATLGWWSTSKTAGHGSLVMVEAPWTLHLYLISLCLH